MIAANKLPTAALITVLTFAGCQTREPRKASKEPSNTILPAEGHFRSSDTIEPPPFTERRMPEEPKGRINTATLAGKRALLLRRFFKDHSPGGPLYDTLLDLDYDSYPDYVIGDYGLSGTGIKNGISVYRYHPRQRRYLSDSQLSALRNPTFYLAQKKITGFYIGLGGGSGCRLEWLHRRWVTTKTFSVHNEGDSTVWKIYYPLERKKAFISHAFQITPPDTVLETDLGSLPYH